MDALSTKTEISELKNIRKQTGLWRLGTGIVTGLWVAGCLLSVNDSVRGLFVAGPRQEKFVSTLSANIQRDIAPNVQTIAAQTIAQARPEVEASFAKLNGRVPELAQASMSELGTLQTSLPQKGQQILGSTYGDMIAQKEQKLREMFPDATEESIKALTHNLTEMAQVKAVSVNDKLIGRHQAALNGIVTHMEQIRLDEAKKPATALGTNWDMALAIMDVVHGDMHELETLAAKKQAGATTKTVSSAALAPTKIVTKK